MTDPEIEVEDLRIEVEEQQLTIDRLTEALEQIRQWVQAYPVTVFRPVTNDQLVRAVECLQDNDVSVDALHAHWARYILDGLTKIVDDALKEDT